MAYQPSLTAGEPVAGMVPPLDGSGGEGWLSAIYLEMRALRRLLEEQAVKKEADPDPNGKEEP